jgi:NTE family protein
MRMRIFCRCCWLLCAGAMLALAGCGDHYPINPPLKTWDPNAGYRLSRLKDDASAGSLLVVLMFSGGGTRAATLSYGTLEALRDVWITIEGRKRRLLDEVDVIIGISGGSITAAYYGLFRERIFTDFETRFLRRDVQGELKARLATSLHRVASSRFGRGDLLAEYLDQEVFEGATFDQLAKRERPFVLIGATDLTLGERFVFDQDQFDLLCADLGPLQVARAVATSAALPPFFSPITLWNYAGQCGFQPPEWLTTDPPDDAEGRRRKRQVDALRTYLDRETRPYVHILDGGLVDNLGTRGPLDDVATAGFDQLLHEAGKSHLTHAVLVSVDAEPGPRYELNRSADVPGLAASMDAFRAAVGMNSFETRELLRQSAEEWLASISPTADMTPRFYYIEVSLRAIKDAEQRNRALAIPTSFSLEGATIDRLRDAAGQLMRESPDLKRLQQDLN